MMTHAPAHPRPMILPRASTPDWHRIAMLVLAIVNIAAAITVALVDCPTQVLFGIFAVTVAFLSYRPLMAFCER